MVTHYGPSEILAAMILLHLVADYTLQGWLAGRRQAEVMVGEASA